MVILYNDTQEATLQVLGKETWYFVTGKDTGVILFKCLILETVKLSAKVVGDLPKDTKFKHE